MKNDGRVLPRSVDGVQEGRGSSPTTSTSSCTSSRRTRAASTSSRSSGRTCPRSRSPPPPASVCPRRRARLDGVDPDRSPRPRRDRAEPPAVRDLLRPVIGHTPFRKPPLTTSASDTFATPSISPLNCRGRGRSSAGRAFGWQPKGQGFDPPRLHSLNRHLLYGLCRGRRWPPVAAARGTGSSGTQSVDVEFTRADGSLATFPETVRRVVRTVRRGATRTATRSTCWPASFLARNPLPRTGSLRAVQADVERDPVTTLPNSFVYTEARGAAFSRTTPGRGNELSPPTRSLRARFASSSRAASQETPFGSNSRTSCSAASTSTSHRSRSRARPRGDRRRAG